MIVGRVIIHLRTDWPETRIVAGWDFRPLR